MSGTTRTRRPLIHKTRRAKSEVAKEVVSDHPAKWSKERMNKWLNYHKFQKFAKLTEKETDQNKKTRKRTLQAPFDLGDNSFYGGVEDGKTSENKRPKHQHVEEKVEADEERPWSEEWSSDEFTEGQ